MRGRAMINRYLILIAGYASLYLYEALTNLFANLKATL